ncbi:MAG: chlorophyll synthesis pathway protein BchC [Burkholderiales bacterium]|nr:chlorophyll synthesis pathway protein BchC [Burkholderiales bacterium]
MNATAVVLEEPERLHLAQLELTNPGAEDVVVDVEWSGISTGTERLLFDGRMPTFPGMGYPLVPGYESVGRVIAAGSSSGLNVGERVFVPGANCFGPVRGLFGGAASRLVVPGRRVTAVDDELGEQAVLLALAATAYHAVACGGKAEHPAPPDLIVGHGVLGRLLARLTVAAGCKDTVVWETDPVRAGGAKGYTVLHPDQDSRRDYRVICDVSGDSALLNTLISRLAFGGEIVLAGFYSKALQFDFAPAFMREARLRAAAEWQRPDLLAVKALLADGLLSLDGLITHHAPFEQADNAYRTAFGDVACLKMVLDWKH